MARNPFLKDCAEILWWQLCKSQDSAWITSDDNEGWNPIPPKDTRKHLATVNKRSPVSMRTQRGSWQGHLRNRPHGHPLRRYINSPTFWPPPAMRLLMYSGPSLRLRAFWMAWYSSAAYWYYKQKEKMKSTFPPCFYISESPTLWSPHPFPLSESTEDPKSFCLRGL